MLLIKILLRGDYSGDIRFMQPFETGAVSSNKKMGVYLLTALCQRLRVPHQLNIIFLPIG